MPDPDKIAAWEARRKEAIAEQIAELGPETVREIVDGNIDHQPYNRRIKVSGRRAAKRANRKGRRARKG